MSVENDQARANVRDHYAKVARDPSTTGCCAPGSCGTSPKASLLLGYSEGDLAAVPDGANLGLGCGNPQAIAGLKPGQTVLDLGSGGGFDSFLAAKQVGDAGRVIGVDMTPDMISRARANAEKVDALNVEFRLGEIEHLPVADQSVDVILSNCVINLSPDKAQVFKEAFRVLKPGGRLAVSDVVEIAEVPEALRSDLLAVAGCIGGAASKSAITTMLTSAGFSDVRINVREESREFIKDWYPESQAERYVASATIEATKPEATKPSRGCC